MPLSLFLRQTRILFFIASMLALAGCANPSAAGGHPADEKPPVGNLVLRNAAGQVVMDAQFNLPAAPLKLGQNLTGQWKPLAMTGEMPKAWNLDGDGWAQYHIEIAYENMSINLSQGFADNNIFLLAPLTPGVISGQWSHTTLTGNKVLGIFTLRTNPAP